MHRAGLQQEFAEAIAEEIKASQASVADEMITKEYFKQEMEILKKDIIIKLGSLMVLGVSVIGILVKF